MVSGRGLSLAALEPQTTTGAQPQSRGNWRRRTLFGRPMSFFVPSATRPVCDCGLHQLGAVTKTIQNDTYIHPWPRPAPPVHITTWQLLEPRLRPRQATTPPRKNRKIKTPSATADNYTPSCPPLLPNRVANTALRRYQDYRGTSFRRRLADS